MDLVVNHARYEITTVCLHNVVSRQGGYLAVNAIYPLPLDANISVNDFSFVNDLDIFDQGG
jgi:hypothetical protein